MDPKQSSPVSDVSAAAQPPSDASQRRSTRLLVAVPVVVSGENARGETFREECRTVSINRQGAAIATSQPVIPGTELRIENPPLGISVRARAVRYVEKTAPGTTPQVFVELIDQKNIWGIRYAPRDWQTSAPSSPLAVKTGSTLPPPKSIEISLPDLLRPPVPSLQPSVPDPTPASAASKLEFSPPAEELEKFLETAALKLSELSSEINAALQTRVGEALDQIEQKQKGLFELAQRFADLDSERTRALEALKAEASGAANAGLEAFRAQLEETAQGFRESTLAEMTREAAEQSGRERENINAARAQVQEEFRAAARTELESFKAELVQSAESVRGSALQSAADLESERTQALDALKAEASGAANAGLEAFRAQLEETAQGFRESTLAEITREAAEQSGRERENIDAVRAQVQEELRTAARTELESFKAELVQSAETARGSALPSAAELESERTRALDALKAEANGVANAGLEAFRAQLEETAHRFRESTLAEMTREAAEQSGRERENINAVRAQVQEELRTAARSELESFKAELLQSAENARTSALPSAADLESERTRALDALKAEASGAANAGLEVFRAQLEETAQGFRERTLAGMTREAAEQAGRERENINAVRAQVQEELRAATRSELADFRSQLAEVAEGERKQIILRVVQECAARSREEAASLQSAMVQQAEERIRSTFRSGLDEFEKEIEHRSLQFKKHVSALVEKPAEEIARYANDTLVMARGEAEVLRQQFIDGAEAQLGAMTRGTLASIAGESETLSEEYRNRLRCTWESIREKGAAEIKNHIEEALERGRDVALRQLQKDAEDFSAVAVEQFRARSSDAVREASEAVNQRVGAAAFVVKEFLDQGAQRLESHLGKIERQSEVAARAMEDRSFEISRSIMEHFRKESEELLLNLRRRIRGAMEALGEDAPSPEEARVLRENAAVRSELSSEDALECVHQVGTDLYEH